MPPVRVGATLSPGQAVQPVAPSARLGDAGGGFVGDRRARALVPVAAPVQGSGVGRPVDSGGELLRTAQDGERRRGLRIAPWKLATAAYRAAARRGSRQPVELDLSV